MEMPCLRADAAQMAAYQKESGAPWNPSSEVASAFVQSVARTSFGSTYSDWDNACWWKQVSATPHETCSKLHGHDIHPQANVVGKVGEKGDIRQCHRLPNQEPPSMQKRLPQL